MLGTEAVALCGGRGGTGLILGVEFGLGVGMSAGNEWYRGL